MEGAKNCHLLSTSTEQFLMFLTIPVFFHFISITHYRHWRRTHKTLSQSYVWSQEVMSRTYLRLSKARFCGVPSSASDKLECSAQHWPVGHVWGNTLSRNKRHKPSTQDLLHMSLTSKTLSHLIIKSYQKNEGCSYKNKNFFLSYIHSLFNDAFSVVRSIYGIRWRAN